MAWRSAPAEHVYQATGLGFQQLERMAQAMSDTQWARRMKQSKEKLLRACKIESPFPPQF